MTHKPTPTRPFTPQTEPADVYIGSEPGPDGPARVAATRNFEN